MTGIAEWRGSHAKIPVAEGNWVLVERYVENYMEGDFRLVFKRDTQILEISVTKEQWDAFGNLPRIHVGRSESS